MSEGRRKDAEEVKKISSILIFFFCFPAFASDLELCKQVANKINSTLPIQKDRLTTLKSVGCIPQSKKVILAYIHEVTISAESMKKINLEKEIKPNNLNTFCSDPNIRVVLNIFDVDFRYYTTDGKFGGSFSITSKECKK